MRRSCALPHIVLVIALSRYRRLWPIGCWTRIRAAPLVAFEPRLGAVPLGNGVTAPLVPGPKYSTASHRHPVRRRALPLGPRLAGGHLHPLQRLSTTSATELRIPMYATIAYVVSTALKKANTAFVVFPRTHRRLNV